MALPRCCWLQLLTVLAHRCLLVVREERRSSWLKYFRRLKVSVDGCAEPSAQNADPEEQEPEVVARSGGA